MPLQLAEDRSAPAEKGANGKPERSYKIVTQYSMGPIEEIGLLKMDFLGLRNLDVIEDAVDIIRRSRGIELDIESIPVDDLTTYEMLARGESVGVFQFESDGMRDALRKVKPTEFNDLVAIGALYRPGRDAIHRRLRERQAGPRIDQATPTRGCARSRSRPMGAASTRSS